MSLYVNKRYVDIAMHFKCNLKCAHCMLAGRMDSLRGHSYDELDEIFEEAKAEGSWDGIIFSGAEITLDRDLPRYANAARKAGFGHVRIQTHGMRLADVDYVSKLVDSGINQFYVSIATGDAATNDAISGTPGSFDKILAGLENLDRFDGVQIITNTVITTLSYPHLRSVVDALADLKNLVQMELWNYFPMAATDERDLVARHADIQPHLLAAIERALSLGRTVAVQRFPECLLGPHRECLDNTAPRLIIDPTFWDALGDCGFGQCRYRDACAHNGCTGLSSAYIDRFGWDEGELRPYQKVP